MTTDEENPTLQTETSERIPLSRQVENMLARLREQKRSRVCPNQSVAMDDGARDTNEKVNFLVSGNIFT